MYSTRVQVHMYDFWASTHFAGFTWWHTFPKVAVHPCLWATVVLPVQQHHYHQRCSWSRCCRVGQHSSLRGGRCHGRQLRWHLLLNLFLASECFLGACGAVICTREKNSCRDVARTLTFYHLHYSVRHLSVTLT